MQVSINGILSFGSAFPRYKLICGFPCISIPAIAPLWTDLDFSSRGGIYYRASATLERVADMIYSWSECSFEGLPAMLAVIVTWFEARLLWYVLD